MSRSDSPLDRSWTLVGLNGEAQSDASSTESSDFVHFDEAQVSYHHRRETSQPGEDIEKDEERVVDGKEEEERHERLQEELECPTSEVLTEEINASSDADGERASVRDSPGDTRSISSIEILDTPSIEEMSEFHARHPLGSTSEAVPEEDYVIPDPTDARRGAYHHLCAEAHLSSSSIEELSMSENEAERPRSSAKQEGRRSPPTGRKSASPKTGRKQGSHSPSLLVDDASCSDCEDSPAEEFERIKNRPKTFPAFSRLRRSGSRKDSTESEHSDFVCLDTMAEEADSAGPLYGSTHSSNGSSLSSSFSFVTCHYPYPHDQAREKFARRLKAAAARRYSDHDDDADSVPSDVDDRCESDISGIADDSDLSTRSLGDVPIVAGNVVRSYKHRPNASLNTFLTTVALIALFMAVGVGIGHYIGSVRELTLRQAQVSKMHSLQDDYLVCLRDQERLGNKLKTPSPREKKLTAAVDIWQQKYEELVLEKAELVQQIRAMEESMAEDLQQANQQMLLYQVEASKIGEELAQLKGEGNLTKPAPQAPSSANSFIFPEDEPESESSGGDGVSKELESMQLQLSEKDEELTDVKNWLQYVEYENTQLRAELAANAAAASASSSSEPEPPTVSADHADDETASLKQEMNHLMTENADLKAEVARIRYAAVAPISSPEAQSSDGEELAHIGQLQRRLADVKWQLEKQKRCSLFWRSLHLDSLQSQPSAEAVSLSSCLSLLVPNVTKLPQYVNVTHNLRPMWEFVTNVTLDTEFSASLQKKWEEMQNYVTPEEGYSQRVGILAEEMKQTLSKRWEEFQDFAQNSKIASKVSEAVKNVSESVKHSEKIQNILDRTKQGISSIADKISSTLYKVKDMSVDLLKEEGHLKDIGKAIKDNMSKFGKNLKKGWEKVQDRITKKVWSGKHACKGKHCKGKDLKQRPLSAEFPFGKKCHGKQCHQTENPESRFERVKETIHGKKDHVGYGQRRQEFFQDRFSHGASAGIFHHVPEEDFELKPQHKQKQSSDHDQEVYAEFWEQAEFEPDDLLPDGFFEGNQREWRKHQRKFQKLHGRIRRLNEDMLVDLDDDDIDDLYDDLDDLQDDLEVMDVPERLMQWLTCQIRWWKSRIHRKHRNENLVKGCGRQLMKWQLRALCKASCHGRKCHDWEQLSERLAPLCVLMEERTNPPQQGFQPHQSGNDQCNSVEITASNRMQPLHGTADLGQNGLLRFSLKPDRDDSNEAPEPAAEGNRSVELHYRSDSEAGGSEAKWYWGRVEDREDRRHNPRWYLRAMEERIDPDASWYLKSMYDERNHGSSAKWVFSRAHEREASREKGKDHLRKRIHLGG